MVYKLHLNKTAKSDMFNHTIRWQERVEQGANIPDSHFIGLSSGPSCFNTRLTC